MPSPTDFNLSPYMMTLPSQKSSIEFFSDLVLPFQAKRINTDTNQSYKIR